MARIEPSTPNVESKAKLFAPASSLNTDTGNTKPEFGSPKTMFCVKFHVVWAIIR